MTPEQRAYRDMWLAEMGAPCRERSREERAEKRKDDRLFQQQIEDREAAVAVPTNTDPLVDNLSTSCAEIGGQKSSQAVSECA